MPDIVKTGFKFKNFCENVPWFFTISHDKRTNTYDLFDMNGTLIKEFPTRKAAECYRKVLTKNYDYLN